MWFVRRLLCVIGFTYAFADEWGYYRTGSKTNNFNNKRTQTILEEECKRQHSGHLLLSTFTVQLQQWNLRYTPPPQHRITCVDVSCWSLPVRSVLNLLRRYNRSLRAETLAEESFYFAPSCEDSDMGGDSDMCEDLDAYGTTWCSRFFRL